MTDALATRSESAPGGVGTKGRLFLLELSGDRIRSMNPEGSDQKVIATDCHLPDGVAIDVEAGHIYWTNMGIPYLDDGSIERADLDGGNRTVIVPQGVTFTPKQLHLEKRSGKLYWCDREGMRVMRADLDGTNVETLVDTSQGDDNHSDATKWCVGITVDPERRQVYWTQKGADNSNLGRIFRAGLDIPEGEGPSNRTDIEIWFDDLPEPIDLELDLETRLMYWTDRGNPPQGNTVNRASVDAPATNGRKPELLISDLMEGIGVALDIAGNRMFATDLGGSLYTAKLDGSEKRTLLFAQGNLSGVAYAEIPSQEK
jgi:DNA-binding beta-propeller fold protein YncE